MRFLGLVLLAGAIPAVATTLTVTAYDFGTSCTNSGATYASCLLTTPFNPFTGDVGSQGLANETLTWLNPTLVEIQGTFNTYVGYRLQNTMFGGTAHADAQATFTIPSNWSSADVISSYDGLQDETLGDRSYATISGPGGFCINRGVGDLSCSFAFAPGTSPSLGFEAGGGVDYFGSYNYGNFDYRIIGTIAPTSTPEPSGLALLGLSAMGAAIAFRKKLKR